ncbi:MAG: flagellar motor protein MotA [Alphaproteobacteria bacterium]|nr:flagellar motor protein MotA [Alphaproteobacteria bacterium]
MARAKSYAFSTLQLAPYLFRMTLFLGLAALAVAFIIQSVAHAFLANPFLNGLILAVLAIGVLNAYRLVWQLLPDIRWVGNLRRTDPSLSPVTSVQPHLLAPLANMLADSRGRLSLTVPAARSILDGVQARLDESRDIARYMTGLLVFLGLLGTFWGLILVVDSVANTIRSLPTGSEGAIAFDQLRAGLEGPLSGMGTAFSSSLFGLAGSLILGFLDLQSGQAQNRFYNALEEWMSTVTRLGSASSAVLESGDASAPAYVTALLEQTAENLENLERTLVRLEERRMAGGESGGAEIATALRGLESAMRALAQEQTAGRDAFVQELRQEVKLLGRTLAAMGDRQKA